MAGLQHIEGEHDDFFFSAIEDAFAGVEHWANEHALWRTLDAEGRRAAVARVGALVRYEREGGWSVAAEAMGLTQHGFFGLLRRWRSKRSLATIVPQLKSRRESAGARLKGGIPTVVREVVRENPDWSRDSLVEEIRRRLPPPAPSSSSVRYLVDRERVELERAGLGGCEGFGRRIVAASSPVVLRLAKRERAAAAIAGFVIDVATGRILAAAAASSAAEALRAASTSAAGRIAGLQEAGPAGVEADYEIEVAGWPIEMARSIRQLGALPLRATVVDVDFDVRTRSRVLELLGPRLGSLTLKLRMPPAAAAAANAAFGDDGMSPEEVVGRRLRMEVDRRDEVLGSELPRLAVDRARLAEGLRLIAASI